ncbi:MAG TPA: potassium-transporting ATPase subunit A [Rhodospirillaceae bacterium]|nr:potassium-transporting ATPase subunit A [Rhodospirillaceae bacterium]
MAAVFAGERTFLSRLIEPVEKTFYRLCCIDPTHEMGWKEYTVNTLVFSFYCGASLFLILLFQAYPVVDADVAFNVATGYITGTNWQATAPEVTLSALSQMIGITTQNFLSAAVGLAVLMALTRGLTRDRTTTIGNVWVDTVRATLYLLLPACILFALFLISQGVVQTFGGLQLFSTLEPDSAQTILTGPIASVGAIKQLGTDGGGYYAANAAHPLENPTPLSNFFQMLAMVLIPAASCITYGKMTGNMKQGVAILAAMVLLFIPFSLYIAAVEQGGNPLLAPMGIDQSLGNMEGKELRWGTTGSSLWATLTTATSGGTTNAALASFLPLSAAASLFLIHIGEIIFGGVGSGLYVMLAYVLLTVFIAGLMIGRTPSYLGKKIGVFEMQMISIIIIIPVLFALGTTALAVLLPDAHEATTSPHAQAFNDILHAYSSASNNNGTGLGGLNTDTPFYNISLGICILIGRFGVIAAVLALAGSMAGKGAIPDKKRSLNTTTPLFVFVLVFVILMSAMAFAPSILIGFSHEHYHLAGGL